MQGGRRGGGTGSALTSTSFPSNASPSWRIKLFSIFHCIPGKPSRIKNRTSRKPRIAAPWRWLTHLATGCSLRLFLLIFVSSSSCRCMHRGGWGLVQHLKSLVKLLLMSLDLLPCLCCYQREELLHHGRIKAASVGQRRTAVSSFPLLLVGFGLLRPNPPLPSKSSGTFVPALGAEPPSLQSRL